MNQSLNQGPIPSGFIARCMSQSISYDRGVLHASAAGLGDGTLVRDNGSGLLVAWADDGELAGILVKPERSEIESGRRRVVVLARDSVVHFGMLVFPADHEEAAKAELDRLGILWRPASLLGG